MSTNHQVTVTGTITSIPVKEEATEMYLFWVDVSVPAGQQTNYYHVLCHAPIAGNDEKRVNALMEKYQVEKRFLFQGRFLFDDFGNPILREADGQPYAAYDLVLNSANYIGPIADLPDVFNCIFALTVTKNPESTVVGEKATTKWHMNGVVNRNVKDDTAEGGYKNFPMWIGCTAWGDKNNDILVSKDLKKGMLVWIEGTPSPDKERTGYIKPFWGKIKDKGPDGKDLGTEHEGWRTSFDLLVNTFSVKMLNKGGGGGGIQQQPPEFDEIPF